MDTKKTMLDNKGQISILYFVLSSVAYSYQNTNIRYRYAYRSEQKFFSKTLSGCFHFENMKITFQDEFLDRIRTVSQVGEDLLVSIDVIQLQIKFSF